MKGLRTIKKAFFALLFSVIILLSAVAGLIGTFSSSSSFSSQDSSSASSSEHSVVSTSEVASEQTEPSSTESSDRDLRFSRSTLSNPIDDQPVENLTEPVSSVVIRRRDRLVREINRVSAEFSNADVVLAWNFVPAVPPSRVGPTVSGSPRRHGSLSDHSDSMEMRIREFFRREEGYSTLDFADATHNFKISIVDFEEGECLNWGWFFCEERRPGRNILFRRTLRHREPVIVKDGGENVDYAVFFSQDEENRLRIRLYSNFVEWKAWALSYRTFRGVQPERRLMDEIVFEANENSQEEIIEWIKSRLDLNSSIPEWTLLTSKSKLLHLFHGLRNENFNVEIRDSEDIAGEWWLEVFRNERDEKIYITINDEGELFVRKGAVGGRVLLQIEIDDLDLDSIVEYLSELISFNNRPNQDFEILSNYLSDPAMQSQGFRIQDTSRNHIRLVRFDSERSILIRRDENSGDITVDAEIPDLPGTNSQPTVSFDELDFQILARVISDSEERERLLSTYLDIFKKILSVDILLPEADEENSEWISLFELFNTLFGSETSTENSFGNDPDPRYIFSHFQSFNTEGGTDKRLEFLINFFRISRGESASNTAKKILFFLRSLMEEPERVEEVLSLEERASSNSYYRSLIQATNSLLLDGLEEPGFRLQSRRRIENCSIAVNVSCFAFTFQLLDNFRINDFLVFYARFVKIFYHEIRANGPSNLSDIDSDTATLDFDIVSRVFAPENTERNIATLKKILKRVIAGIQITNENGRRVNLLRSIWNSISGFFSQFFRSKFDENWEGSIDSLVERERDLFLDFFNKIPISFQIVDLFRSTSRDSDESDFVANALAALIEDQSSGAVSGRLAELAAETLLLVTEDSNLPESAGPILAGVESNPELIADLEAIFNLEGPRFFSSLSDDDQSEFFWTGEPVGRGIQLHDYMKNREAERRNILVFSWENSEGSRFTTAIHQSEAGPEVIFHSAGASPQTFNRLNLLISSRIPVLSR